MGILIVSDNLISQQSRYELPRSPTFIGVYMTLEWSVDTQILADPSSFLYVFFQEILNRIQYFRLFSRDAACNDRSFDASFFLFSLHATVECDHP